MLGASVGGGLSSAIGGAIVERFGVDTLFGTFGLGALAFTAWSRGALLAPR